MDLEVTFQERKGHPFLKLDTFLELFQVLPGIFLELSWNLSGFYQVPCGTFLELTKFSFQEPTQSLLGTFLEHTEYFHETGYIMRWVVSGYLQGTWTDLKHSKY